MFLNHVQYLKLFINLIFYFLSGYYQPAGPLISSHLLSSPQTQTTKTVPQGLDSDSLQSLQQPPQSTSAAESSDSEILVTGGDLTPRPQTFRYGPQPPGPYSRPIHPMHCPTYPPAYYSPYGQHHQVKFFNLVVSRQIRFISGVQF